MWDVYAMEYSPFRKNEMMPFATTCMDLERATLSEVSQTEKGKHGVTSLIC